MTSAASGNAITPPLDHNGVTPTASNGDSSSSDGGGIHLDAEGNRVVGGSTRADGSVRKQVKVRPGYVPQELKEKFSVRREREQRAQDDSKSNHDPFRALNSLLRQSRDDEPRTRRSTGTKDAGHNARNSTTNAYSSSATDLSESLANLSLDRTQQEPVSPSGERSNIVDSENSPQLKQFKPKRKYVPPRQRKKYTLADLDNN